MINPSDYLKSRIKKPQRSAPGLAPGVINISDDAIKPIITVYSYDNDNLHINNDIDMKELASLLESNPNQKHWIEVKGLGNKKLLEDLAAYFNIHKLEMEDVANVYQRPKLEEYDKHLFIVSRMIFNNEFHVMQNEQLSLFVGDTILLSFQEHYGDIFGPLRDRMNQNKGYFRNNGIDYLAYALMDSVVDNYFPLLESIGDQLDELELEILFRPNKDSLKRIQSIKRQLIVFKRAIWAERDKINDILRTNTPLISENCKLFIRDTYDHCIQVMDLVESYKEITASMMDIYLSSISNRMNQIMKVLAVISTIFIPLTFVVGVYGMNFSAVSPVSGKVLPLNMPELYSPYGYAGVMGGMLALIIIQLIIFYKKGWLTRL
jgi:magnesium transporter